MFVPARHFSSHVSLRRLSKNIYLLPLFLSMAPTPSAYAKQVGAARLTWETFRAQTQRLYADDDFDRDTVHRGGGFDRRDNDVYAERKKKGQLSGLSNAR